MTRGFLSTDLPSPFEKPAERRNPTTGATIHRATVEVNGKRVDDIDRCKMIVVVPTGYDSARVRTMLEGFDYMVCSEWIDGTGTLTIIAEAE